MRKRIDYVALKSEYEQPLLDGACANKAELARHLGVSRAWVSRKLKGIKREVSR